MRSPGIWSYKRCNSTIIHNHSPLVGPEFTSCHNVPNPNPLMIDLLIRPWNEETQRAAKPGLLSRLRSLLEVNESEWK